MSYLVTLWYLHLIVFVKISENVQFLFRQQKIQVPMLLFLLTSSRHLFLGVAIFISGTQCEGIE